MFDGQDFLARREIPKLRFAGPFACDIPFSEARELAFAVRTERHTPDNVGVFKNEQFLTSVCVPHARQLVLTGGGDSPSIQTDRYAPNGHRRPGASCS